MEPKKKPDLIRERPMTYEDYAALPDEYGRFELVDGVLEAMSPAPTPLHQLVSFEIQRTLADSCLSEYLIVFAPIDVVLSQKEVRQPDLIMIHRSRLHILSKRAVTGPPDLVVEILSDWSIRRDKVKKSKAYARFGIPEYWIVDPANGSLEQYVLTEDRYELADVFTGDEPVRSDKLPCVGFTMQSIMSRIPELPE
ncbi:Uma2 family endonuclease [Paenibacillus flagellatus]|uniref:Uma2 family endonuclease n=1 Tax=Paenibacillus flagellatus TaxID=2211139 RepID=A0A2V5JU24_9BACL|nr:Uma2 family endonuclease [Paenibacillus flagellatus]PYI50029.1 Uma2 family endonuclease [Paenibacillus flagellatus]